MEENFYILEGKVDIVVDGKVNTLSAGDTGEGKDEMYSGLGKLDWRKPPRSGCFN